MIEPNARMSSAAEVARRRPRGHRLSAAPQVRSLLAVALLLLGLPPVEGHEDHSDSHPPEDFQLLASAPQSGIPLSALGEEMAVQERHEEALFAIPGVVGVGLTLKDDRPAILVLVDIALDSALAAVPESLDGVPVHVELAEGGRLLHGAPPGALCAARDPRAVGSESANQAPAAGRASRAAEAQDRWASRGRSDVVVE